VGWPRYHHSAVLPLLFVAAISFVCNGDMNGHIPATRPRGSAKAGRGSALDRLSTVGAALLLLLAVRVLPAFWRSLTEFLRG